MITEQPDGWYDAGCHRSCRQGHTYTPGRCALGGPAAEPTVDISRVETMADGQPSIVLRPIPLSAWEALIKVAQWVSRGKSAAFIPDPDIAPAYPDAAARRALGALHDAGLLPLHPEQPEPAPAATQATEPREHCGALSPAALSLAPRTECVLRPGHSGSHADDVGCRWWPITDQETPGA